MPGTVRRGHRPVRPEANGGATTAPAGTLERYRAASSHHPGYDVAPAEPASEFNHELGIYQVGPLRAPSPDVSISDELRTVDAVPANRYVSPRGEDLSNPALKVADDLSSSPGRRLVGRAGTLRTPHGGVPSTLTIGSTGSSFVDESEDESSSTSAVQPPMPMDALTARWDEALARGHMYDDDADAVAFLQPYEMDLPAWKRRVLVRERVGAARQRAARRAREERVRQHLMARVSSQDDEDEASLTLTDLDTVRRWSSVAPERKVTTASTKALRRMAKDMMSVLDDEGWDILASHVGEPAGRARALASSFAAAGPDWLGLITDHVDAMLGDAVSARRFAELWLPSRQGHGTLANVISVIDQALSPDEHGVTRRSLADAVRAGCQVIIDALQDIVPVCKLGGVPPNLYNKVVLQLGQDLMLVIMRTLLTEFDTDRS
jgi:hypothetical protein